MAGMLFDTLRARTRVFRLTLVSGLLASFAALAQTPWLLLLMSGVILAMFLWFIVLLSRCAMIISARRKQGLCVNCGYNQDGAESPVCSECGNPPRKVLRPRNPWWGIEELGWLFSTWR